MQGPARETRGDRRGGQVLREGNERRAGSFVFRGLSFFVFVSLGAFRKSLLKSLRAVFQVELVLVQRRGRDEVRQTRGFARRVPRGGSLRELATGDGVDAFVSRLAQIAAVVGQKHDAHLRHRPAVERAHDPYGSVVTVVGGLPGLGFDVRVSVVLVREHEEALRRVLAQRAQPLVARPAARSALLEHHAGHDDVRHARVRQQVHLVQRHVGVHHDVRRGVLREFPARGVGAAELRRRELAADVDVVAKVVLANNLHHAASLGLLHERTVVGRRHGVRLDARPSLVSPARERSNARTSRPRASAA